MKGVKRLLLCLIVIAAVSFSEFMPVFATSQGGSGTEIKAPKKIVSLVFDDSSSMYGSSIDSWAQANYATQVFAALMNPQDEFYITYMSELVAREVDLSDPQAAVDKIRTTQTYWSGTPLTSVEVAEEKLESINESDPNTQYWLVIMTDGAFYNDAANYSDIIDACNSLKGKTMSNGSALRVFYYGIGSGALEVQEDPDNGLETEKSDDIVGTLNDVANTISGRLKYDGQDITFVDDKTIEVSSEIPLYSLSAFTQNSQAQVSSAKMVTAEGNELILDFNNVKVQSPEPEDVFADGSDGGYEDLKTPDLHGNISVISNNDQVIPAGKYRIEFSDPIDKESLVLMYQPAVTLILTMYINGNEVKTGSQVTEGSDIELRLTLIDPSTGNEIDKSLLPSGTDYEIVMKGDQGTETTSGLTMSVDDIQPGGYSFTGQMTIPGMVPVYSNTIGIDVLEYKPDPGIHLTIIQKGSVQDDVVYDNVEGINLLSSLEADDVITVKAEALDKNTGDPIDSSKLSDPENWNISYQVDGNEIGSKPSNEYRDIKLMAGDNMIVCDYETGGLTAQEIVQFNVPNPAVYALEVENDPGSFYRRDLNKKEKIDAAPVIWIVRDEDLDRDGIGDGNPQRLSKGETTGTRQLMLDSVTVERDGFGFLPNKAGFMNAKIELVQNDDGSYSAVPRTGVFKKLLFPYLITTGHYHVNTVLDVNSTQQEVVVDVNGKLSDWIPLIFEILITWLLWRILYMIFLKPKFAKRILNLSVYNKGGNGRCIELAGQNEQILLKPYGEHPFSKKPAVMSVKTLGISVFASERGNACVKTYTVYASGKWGYNLSGSNRFDTIKRDITEQTKMRKDGSSGEADTTPVDDTPLYFYDGGGRLYALSIIDQ